LILVPVISAVEQPNSVRIVENRRAVDIITVVYSLHACFDISRLGHYVFERVNSALLSLSLTTFLHTDNFRSILLNDRRRQPVSRRSVVKNIVVPENVGVHDPVLSVRKR